MQNKTTRKIIINQYKLDILWRLNCPDSAIITLLKTGIVEKTGDALIDETLESLIDYKEFDNWGGTRNGAGRPKKNQDKNQDDKIKMKINLNNQDENQDAIQVEDKDKDIERDKESSSSSNNNNISLTRANKKINSNKILNSWNAIASRWGLSELRTLSPARTKNFHDLLDEVGMDVDLFFDELARQVEISLFLRGKKITPDGEMVEADWRLTFDDLVAPKSRKTRIGVRAIEGAYADADLKRIYEKKRQMALEMQQLGERDEK